MSTEKGDNESKELDNNITKHPRFELEELQREAREFRYKGSENLTPEEKARYGDIQVRMIDLMEKISKVEGKNTGQDDDPDDYTPPKRAV